MPTQDLSQRKALAAGDFEGFEAFNPLTLITEYTPAPPTFRKPTAGFRRDQKATLYVRDSQASNGGLYTQKFILRTWDRTSREKVQIDEHTEGWNIFFYRSKPTIYSLGGVLYDGPNEHDWSNAFIHFYEQKMKGSKAAAGRYEVTLVWASRMIGGYLIDLRVMGQAETNSTSFSMNMIVTLDAPVVTAPEIGLVDNTGALDVDSAQPSPINELSFGGEGALS
jgi:hypothetical protein